VLFTKNDFHENLRKNSRNLQMLKRNCVEIVYTEFYPNQSGGKKCTNMGKISLMALHDFYENHNQWMAMRGNGLYQISTESAMKCKTYGVEINLRSRVRYDRQQRRISRDSHQTIFGTEFLNQISQNTRNVLVVFSGLNWSPHKPFLYLTS
jgi:hypothetical protein